MRKVDVGWGGGDSTVFIAAATRRLFVYEHDAEAIHAAYGGRVYYSSRSGQSGAGYLDDISDLVMVGSYRTDHVSTEFSLDPQGAVVPCLYVPLAGHKGVDPCFPFVVSDGERVAFLGQNVEEVISVLLHWEEYWKKNVACLKEATFIYLDHYGGEVVHKFPLITNGFRGVRAHWFLRELRKAQGEAASAMKREYLHAYMDGVVGMDIDDADIFTHLLRVVETPAGWWGHLTVDRYFDRRWAEDPRQISGEVVSGWQGEGGGFFWRREGDLISAFVEVKRSEFLGGKFDAEELSSLLGVRRELPVFEWYSRTFEEWKKYFHSLLLVKAREQFVWAGRKRRPRKGKSVSSRAYISFDE